MEAATSEFESLCRLAVPPESWSEKLAVAQRALARLDPRNRIREPAETATSPHVKWASTYRFTGKVTGVGLRKTLHQLMDEAGLPGLAYNEGTTPDVYASVGGPKKKRQQLLDNLSRYLDTNVTGRRGLDWNMQPVKKRERLRPVQLTPELARRMFERQGFKEDLDRPDAQTAIPEWIRQRYRLRPDPEGNLTGHVPALAYRQLMGLSPVYPAQVDWTEPTERHTVPYWARPKVAAAEAHPFTVAVDFDGTLAVAQEPFDPQTAGKPRPRARKWMRAFARAGARLIVFTVRGDTRAVRDFMKENDIPFDYINENPDQPPGSSGKVYADLYLDDRALNAIDLDAAGRRVLKRIRQYKRQARAR